MAMTGPAQALLAIHRVAIKPMLFKWEFKFGRVLEFI
jgi:hypothetical protein